MSSDSEKPRQLCCGNLGSISQRLALSTTEASARVAVALPLQNGYVAKMVAFDGLVDAADHFAILFGQSHFEAKPLLRIHSECITGDLFGSQRCDCGAQLQHAISLLQQQNGILLYLRQEGRGIGLKAKLDAYMLQDQGLDTYAANRALSLPDDARSYFVAAQMLKALGVESVRLVTNNPLKTEQLETWGITVAELVSAGTFATNLNKQYLRTKKITTGHLLNV